MTPSDFRSVALVGAGTIGRSWAIVFARAGLETRVFDAEPAVRAGIASRIEETLAAAESIGAVPAGSCVDIQARVRVCASLGEAVAGVPYVQESVPEDLDAKRAMFASLDELAPPDAILASSASTFGMTEIAADVAGAHRCVVVHPTNPPHLVPLVEIAPGRLTAPLVADAALAFMDVLGQRPIHVRNEPFGFVLNRLQFALAGEAFRLVREGVASVADVDRCLTDGLALRWAFLGPFGVEATNADGIEDDLKKFRDGIRALTAAVGRPYEGLDDDEIALFAAGVEEMFVGASHDDVVAYRDRMVTALRRLKEQHPFPAGKSAETSETLGAGA